ncbi:T9SS type A sorting domain-containing protein, partial [Hydrotalea sp.]
TGRKTWTFRLTLTNNINLYSHTEMQIELEPNKYGSAGVVSVHGFARPGGPIFLSADNAYNGETGKGWITVDYANANLRLRRPLIVVEGFDPGYLLAPERQFGFANFATFIEELNRSNDLRNLLQSTNQQYDIIYVDWFRGTDFLQRNALLLERVIRWVNEQKAIDGSVEPNVVLGQSMGGVISRWALRDMENRGLNHQTRLFISWDAPQQGANIPVAYQHLVHHANSLFVQSAIPFLLGGNNTIKIVKNALNLTDVPAARQMLMNRALANGQIDNSDHNAWQLELRNLGYPLQSRNIAVSNGSECGIGQGFQPYADLINVNGRANTRFLSELALGSAAGFDAWLYTSLLTLKPQFLLGIVTGRNDFFFELNCKAQPENSTYQIYKGKITFRKKILWLVNVNTIITDRSRNADASVLPIDGTPGGMFDTEINLQNTSFQNWAIKYNISASSIPNFNFIPTTSALDIGGGNTTLTLVNYKAGYVGATPPAAPFNTPFANFTTAFNKVFVSNGSVNNNEHHIQIFLRNGNWVAEELNGNVNARTNCSAFCGNTAITGSDAVCSSGSVFSIPFVAGSTYSWFVDNPNLATVSSNGNTATITQNGTFTGPLQIMVTASGVCGTNTITRNNVWVGAPTIQGWYNSPTNSSEPLKPFIRFQTNYNDACYLQYITTNMQVSPGATVLWETPSLSSASIPWSQTGNNLRFYFTDVNQWGIFPITATNACGTTNLRYRFQSSNGCAGTLSLRNIQSGTAMDESPGKFAVFPNPAKNLLYVTIPADSIDMAHTQIHLMDFSGKTLQSIKKVNNLNSFNMSGFASGMYLIEITDKNKRIIKKIIKY